MTSETYSTEIESIRATLLRQNRRIQELEDRLLFWTCYGVGMTAVCLILTAIKCSH